MKGIAVAKRKSSSSSVKLPPLSEVRFEQAIVELAHTFGWIVASFRQAGGRADGGFRTPVKYDGKGYVDLTLVHEYGAIIFAEIKAERGRLSAEQKEWGVKLSAVSNRDIYSGAPARDDHNPFVRYVVWRPSDADDIANVLSFGRMTSWKL